MAKELSYEELLALALEHYHDGGDGVYECWDKPMYDLYVSKLGPITKRKALKMFDAMKEA